MKTRFLLISLKKWCMLLLLMILFSQWGIAQSETNDMITYDTVCLKDGVTWTLRITRPRNMFTPNHPDTASRPVLISMPGAGEVSTNPANLTKFGPHYWLKSGWDGSVKLGNGTHYPILITILTDAVNVRPKPLLNLMQMLLSTFHIKRNSVHVAGLSMGGFTWGRFISYAGYNGDETAMSLIKSYVALQGVANDNFYGFNLPGWTAFGVWAKKYGGRFFGLEGTGDTRQVWRVRDAMEATVPGSAYFSFETIGGGAHCCWNEMYNPKTTDWQCVAPITNAVIGSNKNYANSMGTYEKGSSIFQWMLRQGDTTLVGSGTPPPPAPVAGPPIVTAGSSQTLQLPLSTVTLSATAIAQGTNKITSVSWAKTSGPSASLILSPLNLITVVSGLLTSGTHVYTVTVKDDAGQTASASVTVNVQGLLKQPPTTNAGADKNITLPVSSVSLTGTATGNAGATISSTLWSQVSGPNTATIASSGALTTNVTGLAEGTYVFKLSATDNNNATTADNVSVVVNPAPVVQIPEEKPTGKGKIIVGQGEYQVLFIDSLGSLWGLGNLSNIGVNGKGKAGVPQRVQVSPADLKFKDATGGLHGAAAIDVNGYVWVMGDNDQGQHGQGDLTHPYLLPRKITVDSAGNPFNNITSMCAYFVKTLTGGHNGFYAIKADGTLWVWGRTLGGMRGNGTDNISADTFTLRPVQVVMPGNRKVQQIVAGNFAIALCTDGTVWTWGNVAASNLGYAASGMDYATPRQLTQLSNITQIAGSGTFNYALRKDGALFGWGAHSAQMGDFYLIGNGLAKPTPVLLTKITDYLPSPITKIVTNTVSTHVILEDGSMYGWGNNGEGNVGNGWERKWDLFTPKFAWDYTVAQGEMVTSPVKIAPNVKFIDVFGSNVYTFYTYALDVDNNLYCWGRNKASVLAVQITAPNGTLVAQRQSAWDRWWPTPVNPFTQTNSYISTSKDCVDGTSTGSPCSTYGIPANTAPKADAGAKQNITTTWAKLDGSKSTDNVFISYYEWTQVSGPNTAVINLPASPTPTVYGLVTGVYTFQLTVTDNGWFTDTATVQVIVNGTGNLPPVAKAGADQTITLPTSSVSLDGSTSTDSDGTISKYAWIKVSGPAAGAITAASASKTTVTGLTEGVYIFELTVTDDNGETASDQVKITVNPAPNKAPVANAGTDQTITLPINTASLDGSASTDEDGTISKYAWVKISGPTSGNITSATSSKTTVTALTEGIYVFELTVTDNGNATHKAQVKVTVNPAANKAPVANAGTDQTITLPINTVSLNGSASSDEDGTISKYAWVKISGPATGAITAATSATTTIINMVQGVYVFELTVTDNDNATHKAQVKVTVNPAPNKAPVANAGVDQTITLPVSAVTLDGSNSSDADGTITGYAWTKISGPAGNSFSLASAMNPLVNGLVEGIYVFQLTVTDNKGDTHTDQVTIRVLAAPPANIAPKAEAGTDVVITLPVNTATLSASSSSDVDGSITTYNWIKISGPAAGNISASGSITTSIVGLTEGVYVFELTVTDNDGATGKDQVKVTVHPAPVPNQRPVANAGNDLMVTLPVNTASLDGSASYDADGTIAGYAWKKISGPAGGNMGTASAAVTSISTLSEGVYIFELTVTDNNGATASDQVKVTVNPAPNKAPVANAGADQTITLPISSVALNGSASYDTDGTIAGYAWTKISGPAGGSIASAAGISTLVSALAEGVYVFELTVTDNKGATHKDQVTVRVLAAPPANIAPSANAGNDIVITLPVNTTTLSGAASSDQDGTVSSYKWTKISGPSAGTIGTPAAVSTSLSGLLEGVYVFELTVTDNDGATSSDQVKVTVNPAQVANQAPIAHAGSGRTITLPVNTVTLNGTGSYDSDGFIATYNWIKISGPAGGTIGSPNAASTVIAGLLEGEYVFELTVTDNKGLSSKATVKVVVLPEPNEAPVANAGADVTVVMPQNLVMLDGSKSYDPDGRIVSYGWTKVQGPSPFTIYNSNTSTPTLPSLEVGVYIFELVVTDNKGAKATDQVRIEVKAGADLNATPVILMPQTITVQLPVSEATLDGSKSYDSDGSITSFQWLQLNGPGTAAMANANERITKILGLIPGEYLFQLTVTDNKGANASATVKVVVMNSSQRYTESVEVYPNPILSGPLVVSCVTDSTNEKLVIMLYDISGKPVFTKATIKTGFVHRETLNVSGLPKGAYFVEVRVGLHRKMVRKIIRN